MTDLQVLKAVFGWMTLLNMVIYIWTAVMCVCCKSLLARVAGRMFGVEEGACRAVLYGYVGMYKLLFIVFNLVPWLALVIAAR